MTLVILKYRPFEWKWGNLFQRLMEKKNKFLTLVNV